MASAVLALRRPVALAMTRSEDMAASNPAGAEILSLELGADADGQPHRDPLARARRPRRHRRLRGRVDRLAAGLRPLPLAGPRADLARRGHQPGDVRRLPGAHGAAGRVRGRVADRRAGPAAGDGSARAAAAQRRRRGRSRPVRPEVPGVRRRASAWSGCATTRCGPSATQRAPTARASASRSAGGRAATSPRRRPAAWTPTAA